MQEMGINSSPCTYSFASAELDASFGCSTQLQCGHRKGSVCLLTCTCSKTAAVLAAIADKWVVVVMTEVQVISHHSLRCSILADITQRCNNTYCRSCCLQPGQQMQCMWWERGVAGLALAHPRSPNHELDLSPLSACALNQGQPAHHPQHGLKRPDRRCQNAGCLWPGRHSHLALPTAGLHAIIHQRQ